MLPKVAAPCVFIFTPFNLPRICPFVHEYMSRADESLRDETNPNHT